MTSPAVVRRWNERAAVTAARARADAGVVLRTQLTEQAVRLRRVAPLAAVLFTVLVAHAGVMPHLAVQGVAPDILLAAVVAVAAARGSRAGAGFGFAAGLGADLFLTTPLGTTALAYTVVGHAVGGGRRRLSGSAAALCRPGASCFACRTAPGSHHPAPTTAADRARRRVATRRAALRRSLGLTAMAVAAGQFGTAVVATTLGGVPFLDGAELVRVAGAAVLSAPLGPLAGAAVRRLPPASGSRR